MGILNVTADSFFDGGRLDRDAALVHARRMLADGAAIVDVGGESTRPGAPPVDEAEELRRVLPLVEALASDGACVSIDTMKPAVMREALAAGASMINDVRALQAAGRARSRRAERCGRLPDAHAGRAADHAARTRVRRCRRRNPRIPATPGRSVHRCRHRG